MDNNFNIVEDTIADLLEGVKEPIPRTPIPANLPYKVDGIEGVTIDTPAVEKEVNLLWQQCISNAKRIVEGTQPVAKALGLSVNGANTQVWGMNNNTQQWITNPAGSIGNVIFCRNVPTAFPTCRPTWQGNHWLDPELYPEYFKLVGYRHGQKDKLFAPSPIAAGDFVRNIGGGGGANPGDRQTDDVKPHTHLIHSFATSPGGAACIVASSFTVTPYDLPTKTSGVTETRPVNTAYRIYEILAGYIDNEIYAKYIETKPLVTYSIDKDTNEYTGISESYVNFIESTDAKIVYWISDLQLTSKPLNKEPGYAVIGNKETNSWSYLMDLRGTKVWHIESKEESTIDYLGPIKENYTTINPEE